jgi:Mediator complex protein
VRLRRQVYALEEAGILEPESSTANGSFKSETGSGAAGPATTAGTAAGSFNPLEISWLNSRKDTVGKDKEAESWAAAREFVNRTRNTVSQDQSNKTETMDTDST